MLTIIESPFASDRERNALYLKRAILHSVNLGETPFASHGFYPHFFDDNDQAERVLGITLGYKVWDVADKVVFYCDYGMSTGMVAAINRAIRLNKPYVMREIGTNDAPHSL